MKEGNVRADRGDVEATGAGEQGPAGRSEMAGCCGPEMAEMMKECPWASFLRKHRLSAFVIFAVMILMFLISQVGGILGIIAFFRTP